MIREIIAMLIDFRDDLQDKLDNELDKYGIKLYQNRIDELTDAFKGLNELYKMVNHSSNEIDMFNRYKNMGVGENITITDDFSFTLEKIYDIIKMLGDK